MCKNLFKGLLGGGGSAPPTPAVPVETVNKTDPNAVVKNPDVVAAAAGQEASGRVKLGGQSKRGRGVAGLAL